MKADQLIRNARIFTSDRNNPLATAFAVKDGKFIYVGDEAGLSAYEGEVTDLGGKFIIGDRLFEYEKTTIEETIRDVFAYDLGIVEKEEKRHRQIFSGMFIGLILLTIILYMPAQKRCADE